MEQNLNDYLLKLAIEESLKENVKKELDKVEKPIQKKKKRCYKCNKKLGTTGIECRCGYIFCGTHRYSFEHNCDYNYKKDFSEQLKKNNPVIKKRKLEPI